MKYALEEIDEPTCRDAVEELEARKAELTREAAGLNEELSNWGGERGVQSVSLCISRLRNR